MENKHFFFKFREGNKGFIELKDSKFYDATKIPLPIYFGRWMSADYFNNSEEYEWRKNKHQRTQVDLFFRLMENQDCDFYFWIFLSDSIYAIKLKRPLEINDWSENIPKDHCLYVSDGSIPKFYFGICEKEFDKTDLPEAFANINSNQQYNRKTIKEFTGNEKLVADHLICRSSEKMRISGKKRLSFLSPVQFETLMFLIFVQNNIYCSTYRGGTKEKYDLLIDNRKEVFPEFNEGKINIQIKMKKEFELPKSDIQPGNQSISSTVYIYLGETDVHNKLFGIDWILSKIKKSEYVDNWLKRSLDFFEIID